MKKFILGALCATLIFSLSISALAISGRMTIEVSPINIQVNGETFVPKDVNGAEVPVFAYQGTTYAPLRALAEAYGLEVGYDQATNMATVVDPEAPTAPADDAKTTFGSDNEAAYQEFKTLWAEPTFSSPFVKFYCTNDTRLIEIIAQHKDVIDDWFLNMSSNLIDAHPEYVFEHGSFVLVFNLDENTNKNPIYSATAMSPFDGQHVEGSSVDIEYWLGNS